MAEKAIGCARPTGAVLGGKPVPEEKTEFVPEEKEMTTARVGSPAPDFEAPAYHNGKFISVKLSERLGKWVMLCFYPGDFTFV